MTRLTEERYQKLRTLWEKGLSVKDIAKELGGFDHCEDGGRSAVNGIIHRLRERAKKVRDEAEANFWSRSKGCSAQWVPKGEVHPKKLTQMEAQALVRSIQIEKIVPPTNEEVIQAAMNAIHREADRLEKNGESI